MQEMREISTKGDTGMSDSSTLLEHRIAQLERSLLLLIRVMLGPVGGVNEQGNAPNGQNETLVMGEIMNVPPSGDHRAVETSDAGPTIQQLAEQQGVKPLTDPSVLQTQGFDIDVEADRATPSGEQCLLREELSNVREVANNLADRLAARDRELEALRQRVRELEAARKT
jgi:hypothetical protein